MSGIKLISTGSALPAQEVTNFDLEKKVDTSDEWIVTRTGIKSRHYCGEGESQLGLCLAAARQALERAGIEPGQIGVCLVATLTQDTMTPSAACVLQKELGLEQNTDKFVIGLISRLTNQKGLDLVSSIIPQVLDGNTQVVVLGTGDREYEDTFRYYESAHRGTFCACIQYDEARAHRIYAGADALLVPSRFEPCGLTQLNAMHYGTLPIVRETGGLKDTVEPYNDFTGDGNGFTFDRYEAGRLLDAVNRAKTVYFTNRYHWDEVVQRDMAKDVSWQNSARQYKDLYLELTQW